MLRSKMASNEITNEMEAFLEEHHHKYEPDQHWKARKQFMVDNWDRFSGNQLVSLSMVWSNIEFDGATYPPALMARVKEMGQGIILDDDEETAASSTLKQSNQAHTKPKSPSRDLQPTHWKEPTQSRKRSGEVEIPPQTSKSLKTERHQSAKEWASSRHESKRGRQTGSNGQSASAKRPPASVTYDKVISELAANLRKQNGSKSGGSALHKLHNAGVWLSLRPEVEYVEVPPANPPPVRSRRRSPMANPTWICNLYMGDTLLASVEANNKPNSKTAAAEKAVLILESSRFVVQKCQKRSGGKRAYQKEVVPSDEALDTPHFPINHQNKCGAPSPTGTMENFVLTEPDKPTPSTSILINSAQSNHVPIVFETGNTIQTVNGKSGFVCTTIINGVVIDIGLHMSKKEARNVSADNALASLRKTCPTLRKSVSSAHASAISRDELAAGASAEEKSAVIEGSNIGHKMLKMMGWTGGALGKDGIVEPVTASGKFTREGLGYSVPVPKNSTNKIDMKAVTNILQDYVRSGRRDDLIFSSELSQEERKAIHLLCRRFNLKSQSHGKGRERFLVIKQKRKLSELVEDIVQSGGSSGQYELVSPGTQEPLY